MKSSEAKTFMLARDNILNTRNKSCAQAGAVK